MTSYEWYASSIQRISSEKLRLSPHLMNAPDNTAPTFKKWTLKLLGGGREEKKGNK